MERREKERHGRLVAAKKTGKTVYFNCALTFPRAHHTRPRLIYVAQNKYTRGRAYVQRGRIKENKYGNETSGASARSKKIVRAAVRRPEIGRCEQQETLLYTVKRGVGEENVCIGVCERCWKEPVI